MLTIPTLLLIAFHAQAGRPLATEDADALERGDCELEGVVARVAASGTPATKSWQLQIGCGFGWRTQLALNAGRAWGGGASDDSLGLVGKTWLVERKDDGFGVTLAYELVALRVAGGSREHESSALKLVLTREFAPGWTGHANLGWHRNESASQDSTTWNLAAERAFGGGVDLMAEVYGDDRSRPWVAAGVRWALSENFNLDASIGVQTETPRVRLLTVGFKLAF